MKALLCLVSVLLLACGCSTAYHEARVDRQADRILEQSHRQVLGDRQANVRRPEPAAPVPEPSEARVAMEEEPVRDLNLKQSLEIALESNREQIAEKESLFLTALGLIGTRHSFSPQLAGVLSYLFADGRGSARNRNSQLDLSVSQLLPQGGTLSLTGSAEYDDTSNHALTTPQAFSSSLGVTLSQPLLSGVGREVAYEALVQAERNMVYAIRGYELFRQDFSIGVARRYYDLVGEQQAILNQRNNLENLVFARRQAEALYRVGRINELDALRARRSELNARNDLIAAEESFQLNLGRFKVFLGLDPEAKVRIGEEEPGFIDVNYDVDSAVAVALENRLDLLTQKEQVEDAERAVRIAEDGMLPSLNLDLSYNMAGNPDASFGNQRLDRQSYSAGLSLELPLDRVNERNSLRSAQISLLRAQRAFEEFKDNLVIEIRSAFRELERRRQSLDIQEQLISDQEKNDRIAQIRFDRGEIPNRDLIEAKQALLDARNSLILEKVNYEITRLQLLRGLGILFIDQKGMWKE